MIEKVTIDRFEGMEKFEDEQSHGMFVAALYLGVGRSYLKSGWVGLERGVKRLAIALHSSNITRWRFAMAEDYCGIDHPDLQHAIVCARARLGLTRETEHPLVGNKKNNRLANLDQIIGFTDSTGLKRWRVDWDPIKKVHINEEDFSGPGASRKVCHKVYLSSEEWVIRWWRKFTSAGLESYKNQPVPRQKKKVLDET